MKHWLIILMLVMGISFYGNSQSVMNRVKDKVKNRVDQKIDEGIDKGLDEVEKELSKTEESEEQEDAGNTESAPKQKSVQNKPAEKPASNTFQSFSRYDFVPGNNIVYAEDFSQDVIGEFPVLWSTNNRGEVVTVSSNQNKWLRMYHGGRFVSPSLKTLPDNFTIEFDLIMNFDKGEHNYIYPDVEIKLMSIPQTDARAKGYLLSPDATSDVLLTISPGDEESSTIALRSQKEGTTNFHNNGKGLKKLDSYFGKPIHFAYWVQKERLRLWINGEKVYDIPQAVPEQPAFNRLDFAVAPSNYLEEQIGIYLSNIKIAEGAPDTRTKLITEGKWVTNGILFDINSDKIKPESAGVLKEIATVLKENPGIKVKIIGHTDSDGDDAKNLDLSKRRAASVKNALVKEFQIDVARMETDGQGELKPVSPNTTKEGKAQNRRVEFIKL